MISYINGKIIDLDTNVVNILTNSGLGYEIIINEIIYSKIYSLEEIELFIYHHKTENSEMLFGFSEKDEKILFKELIKISGIGGKVAIQILSLGVNNIIEAVSSGDNKFIESVKGVGKKMAEKVILELKGKDLGIDFSLEKNESEHKKIDDDLGDSIKSTLTNMGYSLKDIEKVLKKLPTDFSDAGEIIPFVIRELS